VKMPKQMLMVELKLPLGSRRVDCVGNRLFVTVLVKMN